jgi:hypothetical protein
MNEKLFDLKNSVSAKTSQAKAILEMVCNQLEEPHEKRIPDKVLSSALWAIEDLLHDTSKAVSDFELANPEVAP